MLHIPTSSRSLKWSQISTLKKEALYPSETLTQSKATRRNNPPFTFDKIFHRQNYVCISLSSLPQTCTQPILASCFLLPQQLLDGCLYESLTLSWYEYFTGCFCFQISHPVKYSEKSIFKCLNQACTTYGPRVACRKPKNLLLPACKILF